MSQDVTKVLRNKRNPGESREDYKARLKSVRDSIKRRLRIGARYTHEHPPVVDYVDPKTSLSSKVRLQPMKPYRRGGVK